MKDFTPTHNWFVDGVRIPVVVSGGQIFDASHWHPTVPMIGCADVEVSDYDAAGEEILVVRVGGEIHGRLEVIP